MPCCCHYYYEGAYLGWWRVSSDHLLEVDCFVVVDLADLVELSFDENRLVVVVVVRWTVVGLHAVDVAVDGRDLDQCDTVVAGIGYCCLLQRRFSVAFPYWFEDDADSKNQLECC